MKFQKFLMSSTGFKSKAKSINVRYQLIIHALYFAESTA